MKQPDDAVWLRHMLEHPERRGVKYFRIRGKGGGKFSPHALRATASTSALEHEADIAKLQEWLGHVTLFAHR